MPSNPPKTLLLDTNILIRFVSQDDPLRQTTIEVLARLASRQSQVFICAQNLVEFRQVATRSTEANGLGLDTARTSQLMTAFESAFGLLPETPAIYPAWRALVETVHASGRANFDARIVAIAQVAGIDAVLTYEAASFSRYGNATGIGIVNPRNV